VSNLLDLPTTWGREFCAALADNTEVTGQDAYEAFWEAFDRDPDLDALRAMSTGDFETLAQAAGELLDAPVTGDQIRQAVTRTISHYA
jgi:hypothetical protein